jgi:hypothetical protein
VNLVTYMEDGSATAKDEVDGALDVTIIVVMPAFVVKESVMCTVECAVVECYFVCTNKYCH